MRCVKCGVENPKQAKFCKKCGASQEIRTRCAHCSEVLTVEQVIELVDKKYGYRI